MAKLLGKSLPLFCLFFFAIHLTSCEPSPKAPPETIAPKFNSVFEDIDQVQNDIENRILLRSADDRSKSLAGTYLVNLKNILTYLSQNPSDRDKIIRALEISESIQQLPLPLPDRTRIEPILVAFNKVIASLAVEQNIDLSSLLWTIFSYDFGSDLFPFWSFSNKNQGWTTSEGAAMNTQTKATGRSTPFNGNSPWLVTPQLNFENLIDPTVTLRHSILLGRNDSNFKKDRVLKSTYKLLVSKNYQYGSPLKYCDPLDTNCELAKNKKGENIVWTSLPIELPKGDNFFRMTSSPVPIMGMSGEPNVFIAMMLDTSKFISERYGKHYHTWDIFEFKLLGNGLIPEVIPHPEPIKPLFEDQFGEGSIAPFKSLLSNPSARDWAQGEHRQVPYASTFTNGTKTKSRLIASQISLKNKNNIKKLNLNFNHTIKLNAEGYNVWDRLKVLISENYKEGMNFDEASWLELNFADSKILTIADSYTDFTAGPIDLTSYLDKNISLAFEFSSEPTDDHLWQVKRIKILPTYLDGDLK